MLNFTSQLPLRRVQRSTQTTAGQVAKPPRQLQVVRLAARDSQHSASAEAKDALQLDRRTMFMGAMLCLCARPAGALASGAQIEPAVVQPQLAPDQSLYDPADPDLRAAANALQEGLNALDVVSEEQAWQRVIDTYGGMDKPWVPDVVGRAWGNKGNALSRQGKLQEALECYNKSIATCPWSVDPVLNRGVALEALGRFPEAIADYKAVLAVSPEDPAALNNLGNAYAGLGEWQAAVDNYTKASQLASGFSFAAANRALALYQLGDSEQAIREMRTLLRKYPAFTDVRAALASALWGQGLEGQAESQWQRVDDPRYKDATWLRDNRRWPPALISSLEAFLSLKSVVLAS